MMNGNAPMPGKQFARINDVNICYYEQGAGAPIFLLHGWPQTSHVWRKMIPALAQHYRVIAVDLPGMGNSGAASSYDTKSIALLIDGLAAQLGIQQLHLAGHDIGAWVAAAYALHCGDRLQTLTVIDAGIPGLMSPAVFQPENANRVWQFYFHAIKDIPEWLLEGKEKEYLHWYFTNKAFIKTAITDDDLELYYQAYKGREKLQGGFGYYRAFAESARQNREAQTTLHIPVLAIGGEYALGEQMGNALKAIAPHITSTAVKSSGHYVPEEQPEVLIELMANLYKAYTE